MTLLGAYTTVVVVTIGAVSSCEIPACTYPLTDKTMSVTAPFDKLPAHQKIVSLDSVGPLGNRPMVVARRDVYYRHGQHPVAQRPVGIDGLGAEDLTFRSCPDPFFCIRGLRARSLRSDGRTLPTCINCQRTDSFARPCRFSPAAA